MTFSNHFFGKELSALASKTIFFTDITLIITVIQNICLDIVLLTDPQVSTFISACYYRDILFHPLISHFKYLAGLTISFKIKTLI